MAARGRESSGFKQSKGPRRSPDISKEKVGWDGDRQNTRWREKEIEGAFGRERGVELIYFPGLKKRFGERTAWRKC